MKSKRSLHLLFALTIVILTAAVFLYYRIDPRVANPVNSNMNDEAFYYAQIKAVQKFGRPLGYFGYNGSKALIGGFGAWSPLLIYLYAILSLPFSFSVYSMMITNVVLVCVAMFVFLELVDADRLASFAYALPMLIFYVVRYSYSGMAEGLNYALLIMICGLYMAEKRGKRMDCLGLVLSVLLSLIRPYYVVLFPLFLYQTDKKGRSILNCVCAAVLTLALYFVINHYFCAEYLGSVIRLKEVLSLFTVEVSKWFGNTLRYVAGNIQFFIGLLKETNDATRIRVGSLLYLLILFVSVLMVVTNKKKRSSGLRYVLVLALLMPVAFVNVYVPIEIDRHLSAFLLMLILFLIHEEEQMEKRRWIYGVIAICFVVSDYLYFSYFPNRWSVRDCSDYNLSGITLRAEDDGYGSTVSMVWWDESYHTMYTLPAGFGVSYCDSEYLETPEKVASRYVLLLKTKYLNELYEKYPIVYENEAVLIYDLWA